MKDLPATTLVGDLFDGRSPLPHAARVELSASAARVTFNEVSAEFELGALRVSPRVFRASRFLDFPNGWQLVCADGPELDALPSVSTTEGPVAWLEQRIAVAVAAVLVTMAGVAGFYFFGLPRLAEAVAVRISPERERAFGDSTLEMLDAKVLAATDLDQPTLAQVRAGFDALAAHLPPGTPHRLEFRDAKGVGPNAFALPGGTIVITDQLITTCTPDESIAILAHELGHVRYRHALRHVLQEFGVGALAGALSGDASSVSLSVSTVPIVLAQARYSQDFEREADATGFALAAEAGYSPELFASCLGKISKKLGSDNLGVLGYASTHPPSAERIARAHAAALEYDQRRAKSQPALEPSSHAR